MLDVPSVLRQTGVVLTKHGWRKNAFGRTTTGFCLVGAVRHVIFGTDVVVTDDHWITFARTVAALHQTMAIQYPEDAAKSVPMWNDLDSTDVRRVRRLLRTTIANLTTG